MPRKYPTPLERFTANIKVTPNGCWEWQGTRNPCGYGCFRVDGRNTKVHRWAYEHYRGPIQAGMQIDHLCRNRACANPDHLEVVTPHVNLLRGISPPAVNATKSVCPKCGGEYTAIGDRRRCKSCTAEAKTTYAGRYSAKEKAWREANADRVHAAQKAWREANKEHIKAYRREYRKAGKQLVNPIAEVK